MPTKTTGAEFKRFYDDKQFWPDNSDTYHEYEVVLVNGEDHGDKGYENIPDDAIVILIHGIVFNAQHGSEEPSFETYFKRWRKLQTTTSIVVECDISKRDAVVAAIQAAGGILT